MAVVCVPLGIYHEKKANEQKRQALYQTQLQAQYQERQLQELKEFRSSIFDQVYPLIREYKEVNELDDGTVAIHGKVLIFDDPDDDRVFYKTEEELPKELQGTIDSEELTIFIVSEKKLGFVGNYYPDSGSDRYQYSMGSAFQAQFDIYCIYWPEKIVIGKHTIISDPPEKVASLISSYVGEKIGNQNDVISWIYELPQMK